MINNPKWEFDEIILSLELYLKFRPNPPGPGDSNVKNLSFLLRLIHFFKYQSVSKTFRNPNGVSMKLQNLRSLDPKFDGVGLSKGSVLESEIWNKFANNSKKLKLACDKVRKKVENKIFY
jgi:5-methylcytosine-specific restriction enzyme A